MQNDFLYIKQNALSFSAAQAFKRGPEKYVEYLKGIRFTSAAMERGTAVHAVIANRIGGEPIPDKVTNGPFIAEAVKLVSGLDLPQAVTVESHWRVPVVRDPDTGETFFFHGFIDALVARKDGLWAVDWKTGKSRSDKKNKEQITWYMFLLRACGIPVVGGEVAYIEQRESLYVTDNDFDTEEVKYEIASVIAGILDTPWPHKARSVVRDLAVAGITYCPGYPDFIHSLSEGEKVALVPEPDNDFDPNAIAFVCRNRRIGYMQADVAANWTGPYEGKVSAVFPATEDKNAGLRVEVDIA